MRATRDALGDLILQRIRRLPTHARIPLEDGGELLLVHGSPADPGEALTHDMSDEEINALIGDDPADVVVCGASHVPFDRMVGGVRVINVGSVGEAPVSDGAPRRARHLDRVDLAAASSVEQIAVRSPRPEAHGLTAQKLDPEAARACHDPFRDRTRACQGATGAPGRGAQSRSSFAPPMLAWREPLRQADLVSEGASRQRPHGRGSGTGRPASILLVEPADVRSPCRRGRPRRPRASPRAAGRPARGLPASPRSAGAFNLRNPRHGRLPRGED